MKREEFATLVKGMKAVYSQATFIPDADAFNVWYTLLQDLDYKLCSAAIQTHMMQEKFPPTIADIREKCTDFTHKESYSEAEAWDRVYRAICNSAYNSITEFEALPDDIKRAVGTSHQLRMWACDENFNAGVESSNFKKVYRQIVERNKKDMQISPNTKAMIANVSDRLKIE